MELEPHLVAKLKDSSLDPTQRVVEAIMRVGPRNAALISRLTGVPTETVRYKIKRQLKELGFRIHAEVDYEKLGLTLHWANLDFTAKYDDLAAKILTALHEIGYLIYYGRIIPQGHYVALFALPRSSGEKYHDFLKHLVDLGIIRWYSLEEVTFSRHLSMNPRHFNFDSGEWEVDWSKVDLEKPPLEERVFQEEAPLDKTDLLLIEELQINALQHIVAIAKKVKIHPKTLRYHYHAHLEKHGLIARYVVRWMKDIEKTLSHSVMLTRLTIQGLNGTELLRTRAAVNKIPFLWAEELLKNGTYIATLCIPVEQAVSAFDYLHTKVLGSGRKIDIGYIKPWDACLFTVPSQMFKEGWAFDADVLKSRFINLARALEGQ